VAGAIGYTEAIAAAAAAWVLLGERLGPAQLAGGGVVLLGAFIAQRAATGGPSAPAVGNQVITHQAVTHAVTHQAVTLPAPVSVLRTAPGRTPPAGPVLRPGEAPVLGPVTASGRA
jgi:hypothetical protein